MRYLSVCSGIEAATVAWHPLGWEPAAFSEIEPFPRAVLQHHYPGVPLHGDFTTICGDEYGPVDLLVGGTPCQSFSVAGLRKGMDDPRGNLALAYLGLADRLRARWLVWENVPGVLSSNGGRDFGAFLGGLAELGYGWAYRVLDAQYFGVPQRRRRVFVVGYLGDWRRAAAVLFERHSLSGYPAPRREAGEGVAGTLTSSLGRQCGNGGREGALANHLYPVTAYPLTAREAKGPNSDCDSGNLITHTLRADGFDASEDGTGRGTPLVPTLGFGWQNAAAQGDDVREELCPTLDKSKTPAVACKVYQGDRIVSEEEAEPWPTLPARSCNNGGGGGALLLPSQSLAVRRITPREAERLQGFPDNYTLIPRYAKPSGKDLEEMARYCGFPSVAEFVAYGPPADGPRYKALGNSMAVPCMRWIGERIAAVEALNESQTEAAA